MRISRDVVKWADQEDVKRKVKKDHILLKSTERIEHIVDCSQHNSIIFIIFAIFKHSLAVSRHRSLLC